MGAIDLEKVLAWNVVRDRIEDRLVGLKNDEKHDALDLECWGDLNTIFCPALAFSMYYMPKIYSLWPAHWHDWLLRVYMTGLNTAVAGPRRRAKSAIFRSHQMWKMLTLRATFTTHICLTPKLVLEHSSTVIDQLENNARLIDAYHIHPGRITQQEHYEVMIGKAHRTKLIFEWMARDSDPRGTGRHLLGVDDIDTADDSPFVQEKYYNKLHGSVMGTREKLEDIPAQIIISGNMTGPRCNMILFQDGDAVEYPDKWQVFVVPALEKGETQEVTQTEVGETTWPDRFTTQETIDDINTMNLSRLRSGDMELQNEIMDAGKRIWLKPMFEPHWHLGDAQPHQMVSRVYIDSSQKTLEAGDDWAIVRMSKVVDGPHKGEIWIEEAYLDPMDPDQAIRYAIELYIGGGDKKMPQCDCVKMESKTNKGRDPWLNDLQKTARQHGVLLNVEELVPVGDKRTRALTAVPQGMSLALRTPEIWTPPMRRGIQQMISFTGESGLQLKAIDDFHDGVVWGINDLKDVVMKEEYDDDQPLESERLPGMKTRAA